MKRISKQLVSMTVASMLFVQLLPLGSGAIPSVSAAASGISNASLSAKIGDLGQIEELYIKNNPVNRNGAAINFVLPNDTAPQNNVQHQWMGEMIFSYRAGDNEQFPNNRVGFVEVDTNKTLAAGGSTTFSNINPNNPYLEKTASAEGDKVEVNFIGQSLDSAAPRAMKGFDVKSVFDMGTEDGSMLWEITLKNKSDKYIEFGDIGLPMPWNNKYRSVSDTYDNRLTVHNYAGADSGYSYAIRTSGEGNFMLFTPVPESGARIEYVDYWMQEAGELRAGTTFSNWTGDSGGWFPGLNVLYIHSKDIQKTGRGYFTDASSLVLGPNQEKTYQFKFSAIRAGDNTPQANAQSPNNASTSVEEREKNLRSVLYNSGMMDAVAVPGFQTAINMPTKLALHYDDSKIRVKSMAIQSVHENDPYDAAHIPTIKPGSERSQMVNNSRTGRGLADGNPGYTESYQFLETKVVDGEQHHIYSLQFGNLGNNSVRVEYELKVGDQWVSKFTQYEFNVMAELDETLSTHTKFMVEQTQDKNPQSPTYGNYFDWYLTDGLDRNINHWGDDWGHDNINSITMKNFLAPDPDEIRSIELYLIDFMWESFMKHTQDSFIVANWLRDSGAYTDKDKPYTREFSEIMAATGYFNMYRIQKAYPHLIEYRESPQYYLEKAYGIYYNRISSGAIGYYGEQQIPDMIEALKEEGMQTEFDNLKRKFALNKGRSMTFAAYPYGSEFEYDNTGEEGAYAAAKALINYYPQDAQAAAAKKSMEMADWKTRAMRGIQPTWYHYSVPVFRGGEGWWNFQYTASLAGYIMDDWIRYQDDGRTAAQTAVAQQRNYAAKISNFNAINMGQISAQSVGSTSWRYSMYKGGTGTKDVFDGGSRVMNNGWNDFSGEADEGIYGSLLSISSDIVTDPVFGLFGYGALVTDKGNSYEITPKDGFGKRINLIDESIYLVSQNEKIEKAEIQKDGKLFTLTLTNLDKKEHASRIAIDGAGLGNGYYSIKLNNEDAGQFYVRNNKGLARFQMNSDETAVLTIEKLSTGQNQAPQVTAETATPNPQALIPFMLSGIVSDDGAPDGTLTYQWEVVSAPEGGNLSFAYPKASITQAVGTRAGSYTVKLVASDGQASGSDELTFELAAAPEKQPPQISEATAAQDGTNGSIVVLSGTAIPDPVHSAAFDPEMTYAWTVKQKPSGAGDIAIVAGDQATAYARVSKAGTYVFTFTAADEGKAASKDVTIELAADTDNTYRAISVVTQKGTAPTLPGQMNILFNDGYQQGELEWATIDPSSYATNGTFEAKGKVKGSEVEVSATVYVVSVPLVNAALTATPAASFSGGDGYPAAMNNGVEPRNSRDFSPSRTAPNSAWHNWGREGDPSWVTYEWAQPFLASSMDVYVFQDGGGNFRPKDMQLKLRDKNGAWYTPRAINGLGNELDKYNRTTFEPAYITGIRLDMRPVASGTGILEWKVNGYTGAVDKSELTGVYNYVNALNPLNFVDQGLAPIDAAKAGASAVIQNMDATEAEVAQALEKLLTDLKLLRPRDNNIAFSARVSASYTSPWESLAAINDGRKTESNIAHWGTWGNAGAAEWVQYEWPQGATIDSSNLVLWSDGGGILAPAKYEYSYIPMDSATNEWVTAGTITEGITLVNGTPLGSSNPYEFDTELKVKALRVTLTKQSAGSGVGVGLWEWEVIQPIAKQDQAAPDKSEWTISNANSSTSAKGKIEGVNDTMEYRKLSDAGYAPVTGASIENLEPDSYQIRYAATDELNASEPTTVEIRDEAKEDRDAPEANNLVVTPPAVAGGNDGKIENVTDEMEYRKVDGGAYIPVSGTSIENLGAGRYEIRYAETDTKNPSAAIIIAVPDGAKQVQATPSDTVVRGANVSVSGAMDGKLIGVDSTMEYQTQGADQDDWTAITGIEVANLGIGTYLVRFKETATHHASASLTVIIDNPEDPSEEDTEAPTWDAGSIMTAHAGVTSVTLTWNAQAVTDNTEVAGYKVTWSEGAVGKTHDVALGNTNRTTINGLQSNTSYTFKLEAGDSAGNWSHNGPTVTVRTSEYSPPVDTQPKPENPVKPEPTVDPEEPGEPEQPVEPEQPKVEFIDVPETHWAVSAIKRAATLGIVQGYSDNTFKPAQATTRAEFMKMLANAFKWQGEQAELAFTDNDSIGAWAKDAIAQGVKRGVISGYSDGSFRPNQEITRTEMFVILSRVMDLDSSSAHQTGFNDDSAIPAWGKGAVEALRELGVVKGRNNNSFAPNDAATRAEALVVILRVLDLK